VTKLYSCKQLIINGTKLFIILFFVSFFSTAQQTKIDSLKHIYKQTSDINQKLVLLEKLNELMINSGDAEKE
jgi:hypothetical protein